MLKKLLIAALLLGTPVLATNVPEDFDIEIDTDPEESFRIGIVTVEEDGGEKDIFVYSGSITDKTTDTLEYFAKKYPHIKEISLESPGGDAYESFKLGFFFSEYDFATTISPGRVCLSSCAFAFLGGHDYKIDGIFGIHSAWVQLPDANIATSKQMNDLYKQGQLIGSNLTIYLTANGFSPYLATLLPYLTNEEIFLVFTHEEELYDYYVRNDDPDGHDEMVNYVDPSILNEIDRTKIKVWDPEAFVKYMENWEYDEENGRGRTVLDVKQLFPFDPPKEPEETTVE